MKEKEEMSITHVQQVAAYATGLVQSKMAVILGAYNGRQNLVKWLVTNTQHLQFLP